MSGLFNSAASALGFGGTTTAGTMPAVARGNTMKNSSSSMANSSASMMATKAPSMMAPKAPSMMANSTAGPQLGGYRKKRRVSKSKKAFSGSKSKKACRGCKSKKTRRGRK